MVSDPHGTGQLMGDPILLFGAGENRFVFGHGERLCLSARNIHC